MCVLLTINLMQPTFFSHLSAKYDVRLICYHIKSCAVSYCINLPRLLEIDVCLTCHQSQATDFF